MIHHISPTMLSLFCRCQEAFRRRYIEGDIIPPGVAACIGTGLHKAAETNNRQKISSGVDLPADDLKDAARDGYARALSNGVFLAEEEKPEASRVLGAGADTAVSLAGTYAEKVAPSIRPVMVEEKLEADVPGWDVPLLGILDVDDTEGVTHDLKSAAKKWAAGKAEGELQPTIYTYLKRANGFRDAGFQFDVLTHRGDYQPIGLCPRIEDMGPIVTRGNALLAAVQRGDFLPAEPGHWLCSPRWCGYWYSCPHIPEYRK